MPAELALMEAALRRDTRRRQGDNFTHEADEATVVYKSIQLMFHAYYASQSRVEAMRVVLDEIESQNLFLMGYAFKKMNTWLDVAKTMYFQVVTEHNREVAKKHNQYYPAYEKYGAHYDSLNHTLAFLLTPIGWSSNQIPLYKSGMPDMKYPHFLPYRTQNRTLAHLFHQELLVWRNYTLAVHLMIDVTYTCEFVEYLNEQARKLFKLDLDDTSVN